MNWLVVIGLCVAWSITFAIVEHREFHRGHRKGYGEGYLAMLEHAIGQSVAQAIQAEDERMKAYAKGKAAGRAQYQKELNELGAVMFKSAVPAGTKPAWYGIDKAAGPDTTVFWSHHRPNCQCNECTWPKSKAPFHSPDWRCDCRACIAAYNFGRDS